MINKQHAVQILEGIHRLLNLATVEEWERVFNINVKGVLLCYKAAAKQMIAAGSGGSIIG